MTCSVYSVRSCKLPFKQSVFRFFFLLCLSVVPLTCIYNFFLWVFCFYLIFTTPAFHSLLSFSLPDVDLWVLDETSNPVELQVLISASWDGILFWNIFQLVKTLLVHCHFDKINNSMLGVLTCFLVYGKLGGGSGFSPALFCLYIPLYILLTVENLLTLQKKLLSIASLFSVISSLADQL